MSEPCQLTTEEVLGRLKGVRPKEHGGGWWAICPAHSGRRSLAVAKGTRSGGYNTLIYCHGGCSFEKVVAAIPIRPGESL